MFTIGQSIFYLKVSDKVDLINPIFQVQELRISKIEGQDIYLSNGNGLEIDKTLTFLIDEKPSIFNSPLGHRFYVTSMSLLDEFLSISWKALKNIFTRESGFIKNELSLLEPNSADPVFKQNQMDLLEIVHAVAEIPEEDFSKGDLNLEIVYSYSYCNVFSCQLKLVIARLLNQTEIQELSNNNQEVMGDYYDKALFDSDKRILSVNVYESEMFGLEFSYTEEVYVDSLNRFISFENGGKESFLFRKFIPFTEHTPLESVLDEINKFLSEISGNLLEAYRYLKDWAVIFSERSYYEFLEQNFLEG